MSTPQMAKKRKADIQDTADAVWVAPRYTLKGLTAWENEAGAPPNSSRFLELADVALGIEKHYSVKKRDANTYQDCEDRTILQ